MIHHFYHAEYYEIARATSEYCYYDMEITFMVVYFGFKPCKMLSLCHIETNIAEIRMI